MSVENLKSQILTYFGTIASPATDSLSIRDFNAQLMSNMFDANVREALPTALDQLVAEGLLVLKSPGSYGLTDEGVTAAAAAKSAKARNIASKR